MKLRVYLVTLFIFLAAFGGNCAAESEKINIAGSGGMIPLVTELARVYMSENRDVLIAVKQTSVQSSGGISGVADGSLQIGMLNRALKDDEKALGLEVTNIALVGIVAGVNRNIPLREITSENLCGIYEGKITNWSNLGLPAGRISAFTKPEKDSTKEAIRKGITCFKNLKEADSVVVVQSSPEMRTALSASKAIGLTETVVVDASNGAIVALKLDGIEPSQENIRTGKYKATQTYRLATKGRPNGHVKKFIDFIKGTKGKKIIEDYHALTVK